MAGTRAEEPYRYASVLAATNPLSCEQHHTQSLRFGVSAGGLRGLDELEVFGV
jgi:hypothetical protein